MAVMLMAWAVLLIGIATAEAAAQKPGSRSGELAQQRVTPQELAPEHGAAVPGSHIVLFHKRSFNLSRLREAILARRPDAELQRIIQAYQAAVKRDQAGFAAAVERLGGTVTNQWWIINGASITLPAAELGTIRARADVQLLVPNRHRRMWLADATDSKHHGSDQANLLKDAQKRLILGTGVSVAVLDGGIDESMGAANRPHSAFYPGGNPNNKTGGGIQGSLIQATASVSGQSTEDINGHGTFVAGCVAANKWTAVPGADNAIAPGAGIVAVQIADKFGLTNDRWLISGWQWVATSRLKYNIGVAVNAYSGSPLVNDPVQRALDSTAHNADVLITVAGGNLSGNSKDSQHAYNGLAVGSIDKKFLSRSSFSVTGPLHQTGRTYPDIVAVGANLHSVAIDDETTTANSSGTSYAAPLVSGTAALVRQANPALTALQVKAILLNTTNVNSNDRNQYGVGVMRADNAVNAALTWDAVPGTVTSQKPVVSFEFPVVANQQYAVTTTWNRQLLALSQSPNLDLRIYDSNNNRVTQDLNKENSYEKVLFTAASNSTYRAEITWTNKGIGGTSIRFAIAGVTHTLKPKITSISPATVVSYKPGQVTLKGQFLASTQSVTMGTTPVAQFDVINDDELVFTPVTGFPIGTVPITVTNFGGNSNTATLTVTGASPPVMVGPGIVARDPKLQQRYDIHSGKLWRSLLLLSDNNKPSTLQGVYNLGIGDNFKTLFPVIYLDHGTNGTATLKLIYPPSLPRFTFYFQALSVDPKSLTLPFPATNVLKVQVF